MCGRKAQAEVVKLNGSSTVRDLCDAYYQSNDFNMLRDSTKVDYKYFLAVLCEEMGDKKFHAVRSKQLRLRMKCGLNVVSALPIMSAR
jgi:hypothetical protein